MSTLILAAVIGILVVLALTHYYKQKGSCGDCQCSCPIKEDMKKTQQIKK